MSTVTIKIELLDAASASPLYDGEKTQANSVHAALSNLILHGRDARALAWLEENVGRITVMPCA